MGPRPTGARHAVAPATQALAIDSSPYLCFGVAGGTYALALRHVNEIVPYRNVTRVPCGSACVRGLFDLRGRALLAVDLAVALGRPETTAGPRTCLVIVDVVMGDQATTLGLMVEAVDQVVDVRPSDLEPPSGLGSSTLAPGLEGLARLGEREVRLLDLQGLLALERVVSDADGPAVGSRPGAMTVSRDVEGCR